jgi:hypothetical protein
MTPRAAGLRGALARVTVDGSDSDIRQIDIQQSIGDEQRITVQALP